MSSLIQKNGCLLTSFRLYLTTRLARPNLQEHLFHRVNVVDFNVGRSVIESQLLTYVLRHETQHATKDQKEKREKETEDERDKEQEYQEQHDQLLMTLAGAEGDVLDNETLVAMMSQTRMQMSAMIPSITSRGATQINEPFISQGRRITFITYYYKLLICI